MTARLLVLVSMLSGILAIIGTAIAVLAYQQLQAERKHNTQKVCISKEAEHEVIRRVLISFHIPLATLPTDPTTGQPAFAPLPGTGSVKHRCAVYTAKTVHG